MKSSAGILVSCCIFAAVVSTSPSVYYDFDPSSYTRCGHLRDPTSTEPSHTLADEKHSFCYQFVAVERYWEEAELYCRSLHGPDGFIGQGHLPIFNTSLAAVGLVQEWLRNFTDFYTTGVWIGAMRCSTATGGSVFCWKNGEQVSREAVSSFWSTTLPSESIFWFFGAECVLMRQASDWQAAAYPCNIFPWRYPFLCQFPMLPDPSTSTIEEVETTTKVEVTTLPETTADVNNGSSSENLRRSFLTAMKLLKTTPSINPTEEETNSDAIVSTVLMAVLIPFGVVIIICLALFAFLFYKKRRIRPPFNTPNKIHPAEVEAAANAEPEVTKTAADVKNQGQEQSAVPTAEENCTR